MASQKMIIHTIFLSIFLFNVVHATKMYSGQRIFNDYHMIDFIDPAKHGFHIILDQRFVDVHLQPTKLPTVFATAIPLHRPHWADRRSNESIIDHQTRRVTKVLYPENGGPEDGLLDGRVIKLQGLQERSWYYVCVEFESNFNRHEMATGLTCRLKRTLDKFGKTVDSTVKEVELLEITDRSIMLQLEIEVDFPLSLVVYLDQSSTKDAEGRSIPAQEFIIERGKTIHAVFGPMLHPDTSYGRLCVLEEPLLRSYVYTAMGRAARATIEHCYFEDLKTKPARLVQPGYQEHLQMAEEPEVRLSGFRKSQGSDGHHKPLWAFMLYWLIWFLMSV